MLAFGPAHPDAIGGGLHKPIEHGIAGKPENVIYLCNALLRTRTGRKPDQAAQGANGFGSHQLPFAACNQFRLILHTAAYWLLHDLRACAPSWNPLQQSEFATIRLRLIKIAGRIAETASRIRVSVASCCPEAALFSLVAFSRRKLVHKGRGAKPLEHGSATFSAFTAFLLKSAHEM